MAHAAVEILDNLIEDVPFAGEVQEKVPGATPAAWTILTIDAS
jgi:hypothetical protein